MQNNTEPNDKIIMLDHLLFSYYDYGMFVVLLLISTLIGVYFGIYKKQNTLSDYLLGGKNMKVFPVAVSLAASYTSAITLLGMPSEIYSYGSQYFMSCICAFVTSTTTAFIYLPVFYELQLTSSFEYLSLRFDRKVCIAISFISLLGYFMNLPIVIYVPSLAFNQVTGIDMKFITGIVCCICIFYTTIGGFKAVVWTDTIQFIIMNGSIFTIILIGISAEGGIQNIWQIAKNGDRETFIDLDFDLYKRMTLWSMLFGLSINYVAALGVNQMCIQRFLSLSSIQDVKKVFYIFCFFVVTIKGLSLFIGLIIYAKYSGCDPLSAGFITTTDQILPYYVMDVARNIPGLSGLFIAGVFSAGLSTMSTILNTSCGIIYKDFISPYISSNISDEYASKIMKSLVVIIGVIGTFLVFTVNKFGNVIPLSIIFDGIRMGAILGTFTVGMLFPRANTKGTVTGMVFSILLMSWIFYNTKILNKGIDYPKKPFSVEECAFSENFTYNAVNRNYNEDNLVDDTFFLFKISFTWYSLIGFLAMLIVTIPISYLTEPCSQDKLKYEYFSPVIRKYLSDDIKQNTVKCKYEKVNIKLNDLDKKI